MESNTKNYNCLFVAVITPLNADETIDEKGFRKLIQYFLKAHESTPDLALIVNPEAGEVFCLSPEEQLRLIKIALEEAGGKMLVFSGFQANSTKALVEAAVTAADAGVDGLFLMPPVGSMDITIAWDSVRYPEVFGDMTAELVKALPNTPIIVHPTASPTAAYGVGLPLEPTMQMLTRFPQIVGWKMVYNYEGYRKVSRAMRLMDRHVAILGAAAVNFHENLASGYLDGTVTGSFNYALEPMIAHIKAWRANDISQARKIWDGGLAELHEYVYEHYGRLHIRYKTATWLRGVVDSPFMRPPMPKPRKEEVATIYKLLSRMDVSIISQEDMEKILLAL
ncbi:dihydrodipicolinate synthase/N-acetylneuraminate lyase [Xylogone sp. PMI_703]|nr:dihydrodipicolinate synthase/N-acetylneuraminate lyase [Xylogone sp. PMI_703]